MRNSGRAAIVLAGLAVSTAAVVVSGVPAAHALPNGLATAPPMGWNDWNAFGCNVNEQLVEQTADVFVSSGMRDAGYTYVNIDDCWLTKSRDASGNLVPDPAKFPHGISGVASYVHGKGLKLGIYEDAGTATCAGYPGSLGHEQQDANLFASWGVDYLKYDNCNNTGVPAPQRYTAMRNALAATGRPILFSICNWGQEGPWNWGPGLGNLWRTTGDISDNYASMTSIFHSNVGLAPHAAPGAWNDPDMLEIGNGGMTATEYRSEFSLWAEMAAPLLSGTDLRSASADTLAIYTNRDVIAVDQDPLGAQGRLVASTGNQHVLAKPLANGDVAVLLFNESGSAATFGTTATAAGVTPASTYTLTDLWAHTSRTTSGDISAPVPAHGVVMYRVSGGGTAVHGGWSSYASTDAGFGQVDPYLRVAAAGADTWTANDEYGALYRHAALTDGGTVTVRVSAQANTSDWPRRASWSAPTSPPDRPGTSCSPRLPATGTRSSGTPPATGTSTPAPPPARRRTRGGCGWPGPARRSPGTGPPTAPSGPRSARPPCLGWWPARTPGCSPPRTTPAPAGRSTSATSRSTPRRPPATRTRSSTVPAARSSTCTTTRRPTARRSSSGPPTAAATSSGRSTTPAAAPSRSPRRSAASAWTCRDRPQPTALR
jgi:alpha-galactosidase